MFTSYSMPVSSCGASQRHTQFTRVTYLKSVKIRTVYGLSYQSTCFHPQENKTLEGIDEALWIGICNLSRLQDADEVGENTEILKCYVLFLIKAFCLEYSWKCIVKVTKSMFKLLYFSCLDCFCEYTALNSGL